MTVQKCLMLVLVKVNCLPKFCGGRLETICYLNHRLTCVSSAAVEVVVPWQRQRRQLHGRAVPIGNKYKGYVHFARLINKWTINWIDLRAWRHNEKEKTGSIKNQVLEFYGSKRLEIRNMLCWNVIVCTHGCYVIMSTFSFGLDCVEKGKRREGKEMRWQI